MKHSADQSLNGDSGSGGGSGGAAAAASKTWLSYKEDGRRAYEEGRFDDALRAYRAALSPDCTPWPRPSKQEQQLLLSNLVACRLKLGGAAQAEAAVEDAKKCIELNPSWSKGYVRLASAYIALGREHSNDACNALQTALRLDPGNKLAREMLIKELRRDHAAAAAASSSGTSAGRAATAAAAASHPREDAAQRDPPRNPNYVAGAFAGASSTTSHPSFHSSSRDRDVGGSSGTATPWSFGASARSESSSSPPPPSAPSDDTIDDHVSFRDQVHYYQSRILTWYAGQSHEVKYLLKFTFLFLILYVAFGGRFGLDNLWSWTTTTTSHPYAGGGSSPSSLPTQHRGNYGPDNAYEQFRRRRQQQQHYSSPQYSYEGGSSTSSSNPYGSHHHRTQHHANTARGGGTYYDSSFSSSYGVSGLDGGSGMTSLLVVLGIAYICRLNGINPFHAIWMMNLMGAGGRRRFWTFPTGGMMMGGGGMPGYHNHRGYRRGHAMPRGW